MFTHLIIYQTPKLEIKYRILYNTPMYKIGQTTSMGWLVIDIQRFYKNRFYTLNEFDKFMVVKRKIPFKEKLNNKLYHLKCIFKN